MKKNELFSILNTVAKGIADTFGPSCETLIQDLDTTDHAILAIYNGSVSGRSTGSRTDILGTTTDGSVGIEKLRQPHINMLAERDGQMIKSSTIPFSADDGVLGFGINFNYTDLARAEEAIRALCSINGYLSDDLRPNQTPQIDLLFQEASKNLPKPLTRLGKTDRQHLLSRLKLSHFFEQQRAIPYLAEQLGVSRYTIYKDLKEL